MFHMKAFKTFCPTLPLDEQEIEVSENYVAEDFMRTYKNFLQMADMIDDAFTGIKEGFLS